MVNMRRQHDATFRAKFVLETAKGEKKIAQMPAEFESMEVV